MDWVYRMTATLLFLVVGFSTQTAIADPIKLPTLPQFPYPYQWLATLTVGADMLRRGEAETLQLLPPFQNHYTNTARPDTVADGGLFVGAEVAFSDKLQAQLGVSGYVAGQTSPGGDVWLFAAPEFNNFTYRYEVHHARVMVEGKLLTTHWSVWHPYLSWGLGAAVNRAKNYQETAIIDCALPTLPFGNNTETSLTWGVGLGVEYALLSNIRIGVGYQFADLGSASLGPTQAASTTQSLSLSHIYANQLRFQVTFL